MSGTSYDEKDSVRMQFVILIYIFIIIFYLFCLLKVFPFLCNRWRNKDEENKEVREIIRGIRRRRHQT